MYMQIVLCATREVLVDVTILHGVQQFTREVYRDFKTMNVQKTSNIISASDVKYCVRINMHVDCFSVS